ncbi:ATP-binding protein [Nonomuraea sp. NPDC049309]|uniref:ATP-binding protein n=1 Tax=Nonomuraea sp. NPDC049309 TaxID=3364350 RepID=UPI00371D7BE2
MTHHRPPRPPAQAAFLVAPQTPVGAATSGGRRTRGGPSPDGPAGAGGALSAVWTLPALPASVPQARHLLRNALTGWGMRPSAEAELLADELVTNAVRHGRGPVRLQIRLRRSGERLLLRCEVGDRGSGMPQLRPAGIEDEGGRGLALVAGLSRAWGCARTRSGKVVWFDMPVEPG